MSSRTLRILTLASAALAASCALLQRPEPPPPALPALIEQFDDLESTWLASHWANNDPAFLTHWRRDYLDFSGNGYLRIFLDEQGCLTEAGCPDPQKHCGCAPGKWYTSGEYGTLSKTYGYGTYSVRLKAPKGCGLVTGFFVLHFEMDAQDKIVAWDEIDIEILGKDTSRVQLNYRSSNGVQLWQPPMIALKPPTFSKAFDAADGWHAYAFEWTPSAIRWYIEDPTTKQMVLVHTETGTSVGDYPKSVDPDPKDKPLPLPTNPGKIIVNLWAGCNSWNGCTDPPQLGVRCFPDDQRAGAYFDFVSYTPP